MVQVELQSVDTAAHLQLPPHPIVNLMIHSVRHNHVCGTRGWVAPGHLITQKKFHLKCVSQVHDRIGH